MAPSESSKFWDFEEELPDSTAQLVLICTVGVSQLQHMVVSLVETCSIAMADMPMVSDTIYRFPTAAFYHSLRMEGAAVLTAMGSTCSAEALAQIVEAIFVEIAVEVNSQDTKEALVADGTAPPPVVHGPQYSANATRRLLNRRAGNCVA